MQEKIDYPSLLLWLADCQAGTTEHLKRLKSASKSELRRHLNICRDLAEALEHGNYNGIRCRPPEIVLARLKELQEG